MTLPVEPILPSKWAGVASRLIGILLLFAVGWYTLSIYARLLGSKPTPPAPTFEAPSLADLPPGNWQLAGGPWTIRNRTVPLDQIDAALHADNATTRIDLPDLRLRCTETKGQVCSLRLASRQKDGWQILEIGTPTEPKSALAVGSLSWPDRTQQVATRVDSAGNWVAELTVVPVGRAALCDHFRHQGWTVQPERDSLLLHRRGDAMLLWLPSPERAAEQLILAFRLRPSTKE